MLTQRFVWFFGFVLLLSSCVGFKTTETGSDDNPANNPANNPAVDSPVIAAANDKFAFGETISVSITGTDGAAIHFTTDGSSPTALSTLYTGAVPVSADTTINAIAVKDGYAESNVVSKKFSVNQSASLFSWPHGTCQVGDKIYIGTRTAPATITVFEDLDDLSNYKTVTLTGQNKIDHLIYDSVHKKLYASVVNGDNKLTILQINPDDINDWSVVYNSATPGTAGGTISSPIVTDGTYVYGATYAVVSTKLCKHLQSLIRISFPVGEGFPS